MIEMERQRAADESTDQQIANLEHLHEIEDAIAGSIENNNPNINVDVSWRYGISLETLSERQGHRCCWCGVKMYGRLPDDTAPTFEHIIPRAHGGSNGDINLAASCNGCNSLRRTMCWQGFLAWLETCATIDAIGHGIKAAEPAFFDDWFRANFGAYNRQCLERYFGSLCMLREIEHNIQPDWHLFLAHLRAVMEEYSSGIRIDPLEIPADAKDYNHLKTLAEQQNHRCCLCGKNLKNDKLPKPVDLLPRELIDILKIEAPCVAVCCPSCFFSKRSADAFTYFETRCENHNIPCEPGPFAPARSWFWTYLNREERTRIFEAYAAQDGEPENPGDPLFFGWLDEVYQNWKQTIENYRLARAAE